jgi:Flp pilus assembly protein TadG
VGGGTMVMVMLLLVLLVLLVLVTVEECRHLRGAMNVASITKRYVYRLTT